MAKDRRTHGRHSRGFTWSLTGLAALIVAIQPMMGIFTTHSITSGLETTGTLTSSLVSTKSLTSALVD